MFRYGLIVAYFSYLLMAGSTMAGGVSSADTSSAASYQSNVCRLLADNSKCG